MTQAPMAEHHKSLIERMGGAEAASGFLISAVELFYAKLMSDATLHRFFDGRDMAMLKRKQVDFLAYVFGGPASYQGKGIAEAHEHLIRKEGLNETHFDIVASHFRDTLTELGAPPELVAEAIAILLTSRPVFERARQPSTADDASNHGGSENMAAMAGYVQELLLSSDAELMRTRQEVRKLVGRTKPESMVRLRAALRMRGPGLLDLLDQAMGASGDLDATMNGSGGLAAGVGEA